MCFYKFAQLSNFHDSCVLLVDQVSKKYFIQRFVDKLLVRALTIIGMTNYLQSRDTIESVANPYLIRAVLLIGY